MTKLKYNGQPINQRDGDGYVNLGQLCATHGKKLNDWQRLKGSNAYLKALSGATGIPVADLVQIQNGNATFGHPLVAIEVSRWISPEFGVWCNTHIKTLIETGVTAIAPQPYPVESLPPADIRVRDLVLALEKLGLQPDNPRYKAMLGDYALDLLTTETQSRLPGENESVWLGVVERAVELGYSTALVTKHRSRLGRHVSESSRRGGLARIQEKRLCNGTQRPIWLYEVTPQLDSVISGYFSGITATPL